MDMAYKYNGAIKQKMNEEWLGKSINLDDVSGMDIYNIIFFKNINFLVGALISNLKKEEALRCLLDQFISDILRVKLGPELNQQRVVPLHILSCHLGLAPNSRQKPE